MTSPAPPSNDASFFAPGRTRIGRFAREHPIRSTIYAIPIIAIGVLLVFGGRYAWARYHLRTARIAIERGHNAVGVRHLEQCRTVLPDNPEVLRLSARVAWRSGSWDLAESLLNRYWSLHGEDDAVVLERLVLRAAHGEIESAGPPLLARIELRDPAESLCREALATGLLLRFRWADAERLIERWLEEYPDAVVAVLLRGKLQEQQEKSTEAMQTFRRVLELDPEHDEARMRLTTLLLTFSQGEEAIHNLQVLRPRLPELPEVQVQWVRALDLQGRTDEARAALEECVRRFPDHSGALAEFGRVLNREGDSVRAEEYLARSLRRDPGNTATRYQYATALGRNQKEAEAAKVRESIKELEADNERVMQLIRIELQRSPNSATVMSEIAAISLRSGQRDEAMRWCQNALKVDSNHAPTHRMLAVLYEKLGKPALASRHLALASSAGNSKKP